METHEEPQALLDRIAVDADTGGRVTVYLPRWSPDIVEDAAPRAEDVEEIEVLAFQMAVEVLANMGAADLAELIEIFHIPPKRQTPDRIRTWMVTHWPRPQVHQVLVAMAAERLSRVPYPFWSDVGGIRRAEAVSGLAHRLLRMAVGEPHYPRLAVALELSMRYHPSPTVREAAELFVRDPKVEQSRQRLVTEMGPHFSALRRVVAALHLLMDERRGAAADAMPERLLPAMQRELQLTRAQAENQAHELKATREDLERVYREALATIESLQRDLKAAEELIEETVAAYELVIATAALPVPEPDGGDAAQSAPPRSAPLQGLSVGVAGDPSHAMGYRAIALALGAESFTFLDAMSDHPLRIAEMMASVDVPVIVTAWAKHRTQRAVEAIVPRERIVLVHRAGMSAMRQALTQWAQRPAAGVS